MRKATFKRNTNLKCNICHQQLQIDDTIKKVILKHLTKEHNSYVKKYNENLKEINDMKKRIIKKEAIIYDIYTR